MSESGKEYVSRPEEMGSVNISEDVVAAIAAVAVSEVEGVGGLSGNELAGIIGRKNVSKGIKIEIEENVVTVDAFIMMKYGYTIPEVAKNIQNAIAGAIESMTGLSIGKINVHVGGVVMEKDVRK